MSGNQKNRILKIESSSNKAASFVIIALNGRTDEDALKEYLAEGNIMPRVVLYANEVDILL
jgi:hypothetical protein